jgi:hypothetical protein
MLPRRQGGQVAPCGFLADARRDPCGPRPNHAGRVPCAATLVTNTFVGASTN